MHEYATVSRAAVNKDKLKSYLLLRGSKKPVMATATLEMAGTPQEIEDRTNLERCKAHTLGLEAQL